MHQANENAKRRAVIGSLLGTAAADAIGLPYEGLSPRRAARLLGAPQRHRLLFGRGMVSDDTEHACMTALALLESGGDVERFRRALARRLRRWLLALPAGAGLATVRSIVRLWLGCDPRASGVFSAGNGAAMRAPLLGAALDDPLALPAFVQASTRITHGDPKAGFAALAAALAAHLAARRGKVAPDQFVAELNRLLAGAGADLLELAQAAAHAAERGQDTASFAAGLGLAHGVSGYSYHTLPVALHAWLTHQDDFRGAVAAAVRCGGDTDTVAAIVGGIVGAAVGKDGIPAEWRERLFEWPRSAAWIERLGAALAEPGPQPAAWRALEPSGLAILPRNLLFLGVVLVHGARRLLPPY